LQVLYVITLCCHFILSVLQKKKRTLCYPFNVIIENCRKSRKVFIHAGHTRAE